MYSNKRKNLKEFLRIKKQKTNLFKLLKISKNMANNIGVNALYCAGCVHF